MFGRIRTFLNELRPAALDDLGLAAVAKRLLNDFSKRTGIEVNISGDYDALKELDGDKRIVVFRLLQECLTNIVKHAHASRVVVTVKKAGSNLTLQINDDGQGFSVDRKSHDGGRRGGMGILGMRERMGLVGGEFQIDSSPRKGTTVTARIPLVGTLDDKSSTKV